MSERDTSGETLLSIDVDAEVRKLCAEQLGGAGALLTELVRLAVACGATEVDVTIGRREARLVAAGARLPPASGADLVTVADPRQPDAARHAALVRCEAGYGSALLALLGLARARLGWGDGVRWHELRFRHGAPAEVCERASGATRLELVIPRRGGRAADRASLRRACRFARVPIRLEGEALGGGDPARECLLWSRTPSALGELWVGLPRAAELALTVVLHHEVVQREWVQSSSRGYVHTAVLRRRGPPVSVGALPPALAALVDERRHLLFAELRRTFAALAPAERLAARDLLFFRAERSRRLDELDGVPLFERLDGQTVDLPALRRAAATALYAVEPGARPRRYLVGASEITVLDARAREFLARAVGLAAQDPPSLQPSSFWRWATRAARAFVRGFRRAARATANLLLGAAIVPAERLAPREAALLAAVADEIASGRFRLPGLSQGASARAGVVMSERRGLPAVLRRRGDRWLWLLPRRHPALGISEPLDPVRLHPLMLALAGGIDGYGMDKERIHRAALGEVG